jgi:hypothetical protein
MNQIGEHLNVYYPLLSRLASTRKNKYKKDGGVMQNESPVPVKLKRIDLMITSICDFVLIFRLKINIK